MRFPHGSKFNRRRWFTEQRGAAFVLLLCVVYLAYLACEAIR